jgi:branched-chain amino acid transport system ATP-binding protein
MLEVRNITAGYGSATVLRDVSLSVEPGELLLLAGPNGAGKTTLLRTIAGVHRQSAGTIHLDGAEIGSLGAHRRARLGIAWIPEGRGVIGELSVRENLDLARFSPRWEPAMRRASLERFPILDVALKRPASSLSGGEQQMLALARALETGARVLLVDEPSLGLAPIIVNRVLSVLVELSNDGYAILLVEQRAAQVSHMADRALLIRNGSVSAVTEALDLAAYADWGTA